MLGFPFAAASFWVRPGDGRRLPGSAAGRVLPSCALAAALALGYSFFVMRVGGDFMYARFLIPTTPFFLLLLEYGLIRLTPRRPMLQGAATATLCAALLLIPDPLKGNRIVHGIVDEWAFRTPEICSQIKARGMALRPWFQGLPVRIAFLGGEARTVYYARPPVAVESATGLTDRFIARQPLAARSRVGHEKLASPSHLIERRKLHFIFHRDSVRILRLDQAIPVVPIHFGNVMGLVLHWDPELLADLKARGAVFPDFPSLLDEYIAQLDRLPDHTVRQQYERVKRFYFDHVPDPERRRAFLERLARAGKNGA